MPKKNRSKTNTETLEKGALDNVANLWSDFSNQMENKLKDLFESSAAEYKDIYKSWTELSDRMGKQMMGFNLGDETIYKNLFNSWKEYSEQLNTDLGKFGKSDDKSYSEFLDFWTNYSEQFTEHLSNQMFEGIKEQYELYELWMDAFAKSAAEGSMSGDIPSIFNKYWLDAFNRYSGFFSENRLAPNVLSTDIEAGEQLYKQYEEMYNYWTKTSMKMLDEIMRSPGFGNLLGQSINSSMDSRKSFENIMTQNLRSIGVPTKSDLEEIREELMNLSSRFDNIESAIRSLSKKE